jgi:hypothetical protein
VKPLTLSLSMFAKAARTHPALIRDHQHALLFHKCPFSEPALHRILLIIYVNLRNQAPLSIRKKQIRTAGNCANHKLHVGYAHSISTSDPNWKLNPKGHMPELKPAASRNKITRLIPRLTKDDLNLHSNYENVNVTYYKLRIINMYNQQERHV